MNSGRCRRDKLLICVTLDVNSSLVLKVASYALQ